MSEVIEDFDLDIDSDDVADLVGYVNPPDGTHIYGIVFCGIDKLGNKEDSPRGVRIIYQKIATMEKANEGDLDAPVGSLFSESFTSNDMGKKLLKLRLKQIFGDEFKGGNFRPYIDTLAEQKMSNFHLQIVTALNKSVSNGKTYENIRIRSLEPIAPVELPEKWEQFEYEPRED